MEDRPKSSVCSLRLKLATVGDKITLYSSKRIVSERKINAAV